MTRRVWDTFLFADETDLLECRLTELDDAVYRHVLVESPVTFLGKPKPLHYLENQDRFAPWKDKIVHVVADLNGCGDHLARAAASREAVWQGLDGLRNDDILLLSDADEIPRADVLQAAPGHVLAMRSHPLAVNLLEPGWWGGTMATVGQYHGSMQQLRDARQAPGQRPLADAVGWPMVAGWHFTWLGGPEAIRTKITSYTYPEESALIAAGPERMYRDRISPASGGGHLLEVVIDGSWPRFMQERQGPASWYWPGES